MSSCNKTPVAVLHELCVRKSIVMQFQEVKRSGTPNDPLFEISVEVNGDAIAFGKGKTKKEAKHNAAQAALEKMNVPAITLGTYVDPSQPNAPVNPHKDKGVAGNSVGRLQEYCISNGLPIPKFDLVCDFGEPHERTFTWKCEVSQRYETGTGRTKQQAKHNAAQAMYETLIRNPLLTGREISTSVEAVPSLPTRVKPAPLTREEKDNIIETYELCKPPISVPTTSPGLKFSAYHESMTNILTAIKEDLDKSTFLSPIETLSSLAEKLTLSVKYYEGHDISKDNDNCYVYAIVNTQPTTVQIGEGQSLGGAKTEAARTVLRYWQNFVGLYPSS